MGKVVGVASCVLMTVAAVAAQEDQTVVSGRALPQWATGLLAVAGFLFLAFVSVLVKKAWCYKPSRPSDEETRNDFFMTNPYDTSLDMVRSKENPHAYNNLVVHNSDVKITAM